MRIRSLPCKITHKLHPQQQFTFLRLLDNYDVIIYYYDETYHEIYDETYSVIYEVKFREPLCDLKISKAE